MIYYKIDMNYLEYVLKRRIDYFWILERCVYLYALHAPCLEDKGTPLTQTLHADCRIPSELARLTIYMLQIDRSWSKMSSLVGQMCRCGFSHMAWVFWSSSCLFDRLYLLCLFIVSIFFSARFVLLVFVGMMYAVDRISNRKKKKNVCSGLKQYIY